MMKLHRLFFIVLLFFLPTQLGIHFWPDWTIVLGRKVDYLSPTLFLTDIFLLGTLITWIFEERPQFAIEKSKTKTSRLLFLIFTGLFVVGNIFLAKSPFVAVYKWVKVFEFIALGYYIVRSKPPFRYVFFPLFGAFLYTMILAAGQLIFQQSVGGLLWWLGERTFSVDTPGIARIGFCFPFGDTGCFEILRPYATFPHPNVLGGFLAIVLLLFVGQLSSNPILKAPNNKHVRSQIIQKIYYVVTAIGAVALAWTFSRSALAAAIFAVGVLLIAKKIRRKVTVIFLFLLVLCFLVLFILIPFSMESESVTVRTQLVSASVQLWRESPIVGIGLGNFLVDLPNALPSRSVYFLQPVHNIFLLILTETGIIGLAVFLWGIYLLVRPIRLSRMVYQLPFFLLLILGFVDHYALTLQQGQLLFTVFAGLSVLKFDS